MSYILDALKKADQKRQTAGKVPTLGTVHRPARAAPRRLWPWIAAVVVLANAAALAWLMRASPTLPDAAGTAAAPPGPVAVAPAPAPSARAPLPAAPAPALASRPPAPEARSARTAPPASKPPAPIARAETPRAPKPASPAAAPAPAAPAVRSPAAPPAASPAPVASAGERRPAPAAPPAAPAAKPPERPAAPGAGAQELQAMQEGVGKMRLQMVVYSDVPAERLVFINGQKYIEGQTVDGKLVVESILPDAAVLTYQGQRFTLRQ